VVIIIFRVVSADVGLFLVGCKIESFAGRVDLLPALWETHGYSLGGGSSVFKALEKVV